ncbi:histidine phosphatase family protein [Mycolicibacterium sp.]|uniref:histidine phosphatase family protein n=1 Tax=Mycolicibacterium sp. TaxID=2320850 RepID=UPI00355CC5BD
MRENLVWLETPERRRPPAALRVLVATLSALVLVVLAAIPAGAMTITFIRHAESQGNASGYIDTKVPGPGLTEKGWGEADALPEKLAQAGIDAAAFDGIYASTMIRTQQTAQPLLAELGRPESDLVVIGAFDPELAEQHERQSVAGIQEISGGIFEGSSQEDGLGRLGYGLIPMTWALGLRSVRIPGSEDGNEFAARMEAAIAQMEADGSTNAVAFSHGGTMMFWTMMTVDNPNLLLMLQHPLENTDVVVVDKNDDGSYTLKSWAGQDVAPATYPVKMLVNVRDLIVAPQTALYNLRQPVFDADLEAVGQTAVQGVRDVGGATVKFVGDSVTDTVDAIRDLVRPRAIRSEQTAPAETTDVTVSDVKTTAVEVATETEPESDRALIRQLRDARAERSARVEATGNAVRDAARSTRSELTKARGELRERVRGTVSDAADTVRKAVSGKDKKDTRKGSESNSGSAGDSSDKSAA